MDQLHSFLYILFALVAIGAIISGVELYKKNKQNKLQSKRLLTSTSSSGNTAAELLIFFIFLVVLIITGFAIWFATRRYQLAAEAIKSGIKLLN